MILGVNAKEEATLIAMELQCQTGEMPFTYLGLPLGARYRAVDIWEPVIEKFRGRLATWKRRFLSKGGRLILLQSTLQGIVVYFLSCFLLPKSVQSKLESIMKQFLWGKRKCDGGNLKGLNLISWERICLDKDVGGLNVKNLEDFNSALIMKWMARYGEESGELWHEVIQQKYGNGPNGWSVASAPRYVGRSMWPVFHRLWNYFNNNTIIRMGNGLRTDFWQDTWCNLGRLAVRFPRVYQNSTQRNGKAAEIMDLSGALPVWNFTFRRQFFIYELTEVQQFLELVPKPEKVEENDKRLWKSNNKGYTVSSGYESLNKTRADQSESCFRNFPKSLVWVPQIPAKVCFMIWTAMWDHLPSMFYLNRIGISQRLLCSRCDQGAMETAIHILITCPVAVQVWDFFLGSFRCQTRPEPSLIAHLSLPAPSGLSSPGLICWNMYKHAICWILWKARNEFIFEDKSSTVHEVITAVKNCIWFWISPMEIRRTMDLHTFITDWSPYIWL